MNLTNEDRELLDRHFERDLTDTEEAQFQQKLTSDTEFRQAVRLRELIHEQVQSYGAAQLKEQLKANLAAERNKSGNYEEEENNDRATVRPLFGSRTNVRWAIAASLALAVAAAVVLLNLPDTPTGNGPVATEDSVETKSPVTGGQVEAPNYAGTDTYTASYPIVITGVTSVNNALLVIDETRAEATYLLRSDTLLVYYPQDIFADPLQLNSQEDGLVLQINENYYPISLADAVTEQPLVTQ